MYKCFGDRSQVLCLCESCSRLGKVIVQTCTIYNNHIYIDDNKLWLCFKPRDSRHIECIPGTVETQEQAYTVKAYIQQSTIIGLHRKQISSMNDQLKHSHRGYKNTRLYFRKTDGKYIIYLQVKTYTEFSWLMDTMSFAGEDFTYNDDVKNGWTVTQTVGCN